MDVKVAATPSVSVGSKTVDGIQYTVVDGPDNATTAAKVRTLRHPNILAFSTVLDSNGPGARKGSLLGLPVCQGLQKCLPTLTPSEVLYGLLGVAEAMEMCSRGGVHFLSLSANQFGVAVAGPKCHPVNAHRWVLLDLSTAKGDASSSVRSFITLTKSVFSGIDQIHLEAYNRLRWAGELDLCADDPFGKEEGADAPSEGCGYFARIVSVIHRMQDPLIEAFTIGQDLPTYFAADSLEASSNTGIALTNAYERLQGMVQSLTGKSNGPDGDGPATGELERCVFPWLLAPEHLAQPSSAHLFTDIFTLFSPSGSEGPVGPMTALISSCLEASDPNLSIRFYAHSAQLARCMNADQLFLSIEGVVYSCYYTSVGTASEWVSLQQLRYARSAVKAAEHFLSAMISKGSSVALAKAVLASLVDEVPSLMLSCIEAAEGGSEHMAELYRLMRDALLAIASLIPMAASLGCQPEVAEACKVAILMPLFHWSLLTREQAINVAVSAIGTTLPLHHCGFLLNAMLSLCGSDEGSIRNAACTGLLRLKDALGTAGNDDAIAARVRDGTGLPVAHSAKTEPLIIHAYMSIEQKRLAAAGCGDNGATIAALGKERAKLGIAQPASLANAVFRTAYDKSTFVAVLPHLAF